MGEEEDDDPDFDTAPGKVARIKRIKEYSDNIKEAAVKYGRQHGWTAAAIKFGTSSTSVSRWATYNNPKSPWKLKVIVISRRIGVKEAARRFKVALSTLEDWIEKSGKFCENMNEEDFEMDNQEDMEWEEEEEGDENESMDKIKYMKKHNLKEIKPKGKTATTKMNRRVDDQKVYEVEKTDGETVDCKNECY